MCRHSMEKRVKRVRRAVERNESLDLGASRYTRYSVRLTKTSHDEGSDVSSPTLTHPSVHRLFIHSSRCLGRRMFRVLASHRWCRTTVPGWMDFAARCSTLKAAPGGGIKYWTDERFGVEHILHRLVNCISTVHQPHLHCAIWILRT